MTVKAGWLLRVKAAIKGSCVNSIKGIVGKGKAKFVAYLFVSIP